MWKVAAGEIIWCIYMTPVEDIKDIEQTSNAEVAVTDTTLMV